MMVMVLVLVVLILQVVGRGCCSGSGGRGVGTGSGDDTGRDDSTKGDCDSGGRIEYVRGCPLAFQPGNFSHKLCA